MSSEEPFFQTWSAILLTEKINHAKSCFFKKNNFKIYISTKGMQQMGIVKF